jgi:ParB family chromosome partitioning protein
VSAFSSNENGTFSSTGRGEPIEIQIDQIVPNRYQPRETFDSVRLAELAQSIKSYGLIQPIIVRRADDAEAPFELVAGERRLRAAKLAGLSMIPAIVRELDDHPMMEYAILENVQREDLNSIEKARAYLRLINEFSMTQEAIAEKIGVDRSSVANTIRLLNLPEALWGALASGAISTGHAKVLLSVANQELQLQLAQAIQAQGLSVRQTEGLIKSTLRKKRRKPTVSQNGTDIASEIRALETRLQRVLGTKVRVAPSASGKGTITIEYYSLDDLDRILEKLG